MLNISSEYLSVDSTFIDSQYGTMDNFKYFFDSFGVKIGYVCAFTSGVFSFFICKLSILHIKKEHEKDKIIDVVYPLMPILSAMQFFTGYGLGSEIIPSIMFFKYLQHGTTAFIIAIIHIILIFFVFFALIIFGGYVIILTNRHVIAAVPFDIIKCKVIAIDDIKNIIKNRGGYKICSNNNEYILLKFGRAKILYKKLNEIINKKQRSIDV